MVHVLSWDDSGIRYMVHVVLKDVSAASLKGAPVGAGELQSYCEFPRQALI